MKKNKKLHTLVECALMIAIATVLSNLKFGQLPQGGAISLELIPLVLVSNRHGTKWGLGTCFLHGLLQLMFGFSNVLYCKTLVSQIGCILLDYLVACTVLGLAAIIGNAFSRFKDNRFVAAFSGTLAVCVLRFCCYFISGIWLWGGWAPEGTPVWIYSLTYNGSFMLVDTVVTLVAVMLLVGTAPRLFEKQ